MSKKTTSLVRPSRGAGEEAFRVEESAMSAPNSEPTDLKKPVEDVKAKQAKAQEQHDNYLLKYAEQSLAQTVRDAKAIAQIDHKVRTIGQQAYDQELSSLEETQGAAPNFRQIQVPAGNSEGFDPLSSLANLAEQMGIQEKGE